MIARSVIPALALLLAAPAFAGVPVITPLSAEAGIPRQLSDADRHAMAVYIKSLAPIGKGATAAPARE